MGKLKDLTGMKFNKLTVMSFVETLKKKSYWLCKCDCGNESVIRSDSLQDDSVKSCGCYVKGNKFNLDFESFVIMYDSNGYECLLDYKNLEKVKQYTWHQDKDGYFKASMGKKKVLLHRFLMNPQSTEIVDHKNRVVFDNRLENLRICTRSQNNSNCKKRENTTSKYKGVTWNKRMCKWHCHISFNNKAKHLGYYDSEEEAGRRYDQEAIKLHKEFASLNFPESK